MKTVFAFTLLFVIAAFVVINYTTSAKNNDSSIQLKSNINPDGDKKLNNISTIKVKDMDGKEVLLSSFKGKVLLIVNVASQCGNTPQYKELQELYENYKDKGLLVLGFPCNDFGGQEPGTNEEIKEFCSTNYGVNFKLFDKVKILGKDKNKLYSVLTDNDVTGTKDVKWNFEKFLMSKNGNIVSRYASKVKPMDAELVSAIEAELKK
jgi:glutathione peroxidase